jgi:DNA-binding transcriptional LysR family regulator
MEIPHWELSILSRAVHYRNLSGAADHVGVSQPQLSRIVARLEAEYGAVLLDRTARRKSGWTPFALRLADTYARNSRRLHHSLSELAGETPMGHLHIGLLEGLIDWSVPICAQLARLPRLQSIEIDVFDLGDLEERFDKEELDIVFTCRAPSQHKYRFERTAGWQVFEAIDGDGPEVLSPFENAALHPLRQSRISPPAGSSAPTVISNSLSLRRRWLTAFGGKGSLPSQVMARPEQKAPEEVPVLVVAQDLLSPLLWASLNAAIDQHSQASLPPLSVRPVTARRAKSSQPQSSQSRTQPEVTAKGSHR